MSIETVIDPTLLATSFATLFVIMDPAGLIPVFLALTSSFSREEKKRASRQATLTSLGVILAFAIVGKYILQFLNISIEALQLSGGVLLFLVAMELLMGYGSSTSGEGASSGKINVALVPLGTPLLAGPGAIVAVMMSINQGEDSIGGWTAVLLSVLLVHLCLWLVMRFSVALSHKLGPGAIEILTKISGLLLAAIATQLTVEAIFTFISSAQESGAI